ATREKVRSSISERFHDSENSEERELEAELLAAVQGIPATLDEQAEQFEEAHSHACLLERQALDRGEGGQSHRLFVEDLRDQLVREVLASEKLVTQNARALSAYYDLLEVKLQNPLAPVTFEKVLAQEDASLEELPQADIEPKDIPELAIEP